MNNGILYWKSRALLYCEWDDKCKYGIIVIRVPIIPPQHSSDTEIASRIKTAVVGFLQKNTDEESWPKIKESAADGDYQIEHGWKNIPTYGYGTAVKISLSFDDSDIYTTVMTLL